MEAREAYMDKVTVMENVVQRCNGVECPIKEQCMRFHAQVAKVINKPFKKLSTNYYWCYAYISIDGVHHGAKWK